MRLTLRQRGDCYVNPLRLECRKVPAITLPESTDRRERHGAYRVHRTLAFPPGARYLSGLVNRFMDALEGALHGRELDHSFKAVVLRTTKGAICDVLWTERQLRANPRLRGGSGDLDPENATVQWLLSWRRRRELDLLDVFKSAGLDRPAEPLDVAAILADAHRAASRDGDGPDDAGAVQAAADASAGEPSGERTNDGRDVSNSTADETE